MPVIKPPATELEADAFIRKWGSVISTEIRKDLNGWPFALVCYCPARSKVLVNTNAANPQQLRQALGLFLEVLGKIKPKPPDKPGGMILGGDV